MTTDPARTECTLKSMTADSSLRSAPSPVITAQRAGLPEEVQQCLSRTRWCGPAGRTFASRR